MLRTPERTGSSTDLIGKYHQTPIRFPSQCTPDALGGVADSVEAQEFGLSNPVGIAQVLQACFQNPALGVLVWHASLSGVRCTSLADFHGRKVSKICSPKHDDGAAVIMVKINAFGDFPSSDREQYSSAAVVTCLALEMSGTNRTTRGKSAPVCNFRAQYSSRWRLESRRKLICVSTLR